MKPGSISKTKEHSSIEDIRLKIKLVINDKNKIPEHKLLELKDIDSQIYGPLIRKYADSRKAKELELLAKTLKDVGGLYKNMGDIAQDAYKSAENFDVSEYREGLFLRERALNSPLKFYTDAAIYYNYVITMFYDNCIGLTVLPFAPEIQSIYQEINGLRSKILKYSCPEFPETTVSELRSKIENEKSQLTIKRGGIRTKAYEVDQCEFSSVDYIKKVKELFSNISNQMREFLAKTIQECESLLGPAPCEYSVIGLGSMALGQITPYSDLEFAILVEDKDFSFDPNPNVREYFRNLTHLVNFEVINLGESIVPESRYKIHMSHLVRQAINLDLGGKSPLGREDKEYELVQTVEGMMGYVKNKDNKTDNKDKTLSNILLETVHIYGNSELSKKYKDEVTSFLESSDEEGIKQCEKRAVKMLKEGAVEIDYRQFLLTTRTFKGDLEKFTPLKNEIEGKLFDVKQEIYRLPDRLIRALGLYFGVFAEDIWSIIDELHQKEVIKEEAKQNLKLAATFALMLRLKTYSYHGSQKEDISLFAQAKQEGGNLVSTAFHLSAVDLEEDGGLFKFYYIMIPLHKALDKFCADNHAIFFAELYDDGLNIRGDVYIRLLQYKKANICFERYLEIEDTEHTNTCSKLGYIYTKLEQYDKSILVFKIILDNPAGEHSNKDKTEIFTNISYIYSIQGKYKLALEFINLAINLADEQYMFVLLNHRSDIYTRNSQYDAAKEDLKKAFSFLIKPTDTEYYIYYSNMSSICASVGDYDRAIESGERALEISRRIYKDEPHSQIATTHNDLGLLFKALDDYDQALKYLTKALDIRIIFYRTKMHSEVASSFINIALVYQSLSRPSEAIEYAQRSLEIQEYVYSTPVPSMLLALDTLFINHYIIGQYDQAAFYADKSLGMNKYVHREAHIDTARCYNGLGLISIDKNPNKAIDYLKEAFVTYNSVHKGSLHPDLASVFENIAMAYFRSSDCACSVKMDFYALSIMYYFRSHVNFNLIKEAFENSLKAFVKYYSLKYDDIVNKAYACILNNLDFCDHQLHYGLAKALHNSNSHEAINEYILALIFMPRDDLVLKNKIYEQLKDYTIFLDTISRDATNFHIYAIPNHGNITMDNLISPHDWCAYYEALNGEYEGLKEDRRLLKLCENLHLFEDELL